MAIVITPGALNAQAYASAAGMVVYVQRRWGVDLSAVDTTTLEGYLIRARENLDARGPWRGVKNDIQQPLMWPRVDVPLYYEGDVFIQDNDVPILYGDRNPLPIQNANMEMAYKLHLANGSDDALYDITRAADLVSVSGTLQGLGSQSRTYAGPLDDIGGGKGGMRFLPDINAMIEPYLAGTAGIREIGRSG